MTEHAKHAKSKKKAENISWRNVRHGIRSDGKPLERRSCPTGNLSRQIPWISSPSCGGLAGFWLTRVHSRRGNSTTTTTTRTEWIAPSKTTDHLSSVNLLMSVESNSGAADARAAVTWPSSEVAARLSPLPNCSFMFQSFDSRIFELGDCFMAQSSPDSAILGVITQGRWVDATLLQIDLQSVFVPQD